MSNPALHWCCKRLSFFAVILICFCSPANGQGPVVRQELHHDVSPPLRQMAVGAPTPVPEARDVEDLPPIPLPPGFKPANQPDSVRQSTFPQIKAVTNSPTVGLNFEGLGAGFPNFFIEGAPPDTEGAVGNTQYVQWVNVSFAVFDKATGNVVLGPFEGNTLWQGFGGGCETNNDGDPIVTYDKLADRWVFTQFVVRSPTGGFGPFFQCVAVSTTSDATGTYNRYSFSYPDFNDYPKLATWPDAYYITFNLFDSTGSSFLGADVCAYDRTSMLAGQPATQICFPQDASVLGLLPSDLDGRTPPPDGSPNFVMAFAANSLNLYKFHVDFATPANSTLSTPTNIPVAPFSPFCPGPFNCVPQPPGDGTQLDSLGDRLMHRLAYRNFGDHESLVVNHSVIADPAVLNSGVRWYEIQNPNGTPTVAQQSTFAPDSSFRWMGSVAMDASGNLAMGYSVSSSTIFPSIAIAARAFNDPPSTLQPEINIMTGSGSQIDGLTRWGDYSAMQVDPVDDCTFWYTDEYMATTGIFNWNTRIANFKFPGCGVPDLTIAKTHTGNFTQGDSADTFALTVTNNGGKATDGTQVTVSDTLPASLTATSASGTGWTCPTATGGSISCNRTDVLDSGASYPPITLTVSVAANAPGQITNTATVSGGGDKNTSNNSGSDTVTIIQTGPDPAVTKTHSGPFIQGQTGTYTITVSNVGLSPTDGTAIAVTDTLPTGLTVNTVSGTGWSCLQGPPVSCTRSDALASNSSYPAITLTVNVANNAPSSVINAVNVAGGGDTNALNNNAIDPTSIIPPPPDLVIAKTHTGNFNQGGTGTYTLTVSNIGQGPTTARVFANDVVPTGFKINFISSSAGWSCGISRAISISCARPDVLAPGGSYPPISFIVSVPDNAPASVINTAKVSGGGEVNTSNDSASDPTTINPAPDMEIAITHTPDPFVVGQTGTYTITVSNAGGAASSGTVTVQDFLPFGLSATAASGTGWACSTLPTSFLSCQRSDSLATGSSYPALSVTVSISSGGTTVTNTVSVSGGGEFDTANDNASDTANVTAPSLTITKSHTGDFTVGVPGVYTITVGNTGAVATAGAVNLSDFLPGGMTATAVSGTGWSCNPLPTQFLQCSRSDSLASNASYPALNVTVNIASSTPTVVNTASVTGGGDQLTHSASDTANVNTPTLAITKSHTGTFTVGQTGVFQINVSNTGKVATAGTVTVSDFLPQGFSAVAAGGPGWNCGIVPTTFLNCTRSDSLATGASYQTLLVTVSIISANGNSVVNTASVTGGGDATTHSANDTVSVTGPTLSITKSHTGNFTAGQNGTYTITISNTGSIATSGTVTMQDFLPFGLTATATSGTGWSCSPLPTMFLTCTRSDSLSSGSSYPALIVTVSVSATGTVTNNANVTGGGDGATHTASDSTIINPGPVLAITKTHTSDPFIVGQNGAYTITVSNTGALPTSGTVTVQDFLPFVFQATAISGTGWNCSPPPTTFVSCTRSDALAVNGSYPALTVTVSVNGGGPSVTNTASVRGGGDAQSHFANDLTNVSAPSLGITKTHTPDPFIAGQTGTYTITVDNKAGKAATVGMVTVSDFLPSGLSATAITATGWTCSTPPTSFINCTRSDALATGASYPAISMTVNVSGGGPSVINTATVSGGGDSFSHNASDLTNITAPVLAITKTHTPDPFIAGQTGTYTITVSNTGSVGTSGAVTVSDQLPAGLTLSTSSGTGWGCSGTTFVTCTRSDSLASNSSYPALILTVNINNATPTIVNTATVTGGGDSQNHSASDTANVTAPVLAITKTHTGDFSVGTPGVYTITVSNTGSVATVGTVTVTDFLPFTMTATAASGTGWGCNGLPTSFLTCTRSDSLASNSSYPPLVVTVSVSGGASSVTNTASVTGGGDGSQHNASDPTNINTPTLAISKSHTGTFSAGQTGTYTITVSNPGTISSGGNVSVQDNLPNGLTYASASGTGWGCFGFGNFVNCGRSDTLAGGASYPPISLTANIDPSVQSPVVNTVSMNGGGDSNSHNASDSANVTFPDLAIAVSHTGNFFVGETGAAFTIAVSNVGSIATAGGTLTVTDLLPAGLIATSATGTGWTCTIFSGPQTEMDCTRSAGVLSPNQSYPPITLNATVAAGAPGMLTNTASLFGIGESNLGNNTASDTATISSLEMGLTSSSTVTVTAGNSGSYTFQVNIGTNPPAGPVKFGLTGLPPNSTVTFNPISLTQSGTVTMTINTSGNGHVASAKPANLGGPGIIYAALVLPVFAFIALGLGNPKRRKWLWMGASVSVLLVVLSFSGCGGGGGGGGIQTTPTPTPAPTPTPTPAPATPQGTYSMTVTATGATTSTSTPVTLVVQ